MQQWEYKLAAVALLNVRRIVKDRLAEPILDPEIKDWLALSTSMETRHDRCDVAQTLWSERGCWTTLPRLLEELGASGWELVGEAPYGLGLHEGTPHVKTMDMDDERPSKALIFKRPKE